MRVIFEDENKRISLKNGTAIALGIFDGVHMAHRKIIDVLIQESKKRGLKSIVYTFSKHPENVLANRPITFQITTNSQKIKILDKTDLDYLYFGKFTEKFSSMMPEEFFKKVLVNRFNAKYIIVGKDYCFGYRARGNTDLLKKLGKEYGIDVKVVSDISYEGEKVSSTRVRRDIAQGNIEMVNHVLGRVYEVVAKVDETSKDECMQSYNIINCFVEPYLIVPKYGIYISEVKIDNQTYNSIAIVKKAHTDSVDNILLQVSIIDFDFQIHQIPKNLEIYFYKKIRDYEEIPDDKFLNQMSMDIKLVNNYFSRCK